MKRTLMLGTLVMLAGSSIGSQNLPPMVAPKSKTITETHQGFTCPEGYEGHYLNVSSGWDVHGGTSISGSLTGDTDYRVCVTRKFIEELADAEKRAKQ